MAPNQNLHWLCNLLALIVLVAARDCVLDAMVDLVFQDFFFRSPEGRTDGRNLGDDVDAIAIVFQHFGDSANLTLDAVETPQRRGFRL